MKTVILITKNMHCNSCQILIEDELESLDGVTEAISDYKKQETKVTFEESKVSIGDLTAAIKRAGNYEVEVKG